MAASRRTQHGEDLDDEYGHWRLDRRVPIAIVVAIFLQFGGFVAAWTQLQSDVNNVKTSVASIKEESKEVTKRLELLLVLEARLSYTQRAITDLTETVNGILQYEWQRRNRSNGRRETRRTEDDPPPPRRF